MTNKWKVIAILFMVLFGLLLAFNVWAYKDYMDEEESLNDCYYNICSDYPQADYQDGLCSCYDVNEYGEYELAFTKYTS